MDSLVLVHFGDNDFAARYQTLLDNFAQWRAKTGSVESVDLRFNGEAVVNPDTVVAQQITAQPVAPTLPSAKRVHTAHKNSAKKSR